MRRYPLAGRMAERTKATYLVGIDELD